MNKSITLQPVGVDMVVELVSGMAGVQSPDGSFVFRDQLGPGIVREIGDEGTLLVHWAAADFDTWVELPDVQALDPAAI